MPPQAAPKAAASQAQASQPASHDGTSLKDSYIPVFDGQPSSYQEWRKRIGIYHLKMKLQKHTEESILNIIGLLQGTAWKLVEGFDLDKIDKEGTFDDLMKLLDNAFRSDSRVRLPQDFDAYFSHLSGKPGETLLSYVTEHDEKLRKVQEHGIQIPDEVQGWLLLKKSNVTKEQKQMIITQAPKMEKLRIQEAVYLILGQDHRSAVSHDHRRPGSGRLFRRGAYTAADQYDDDDDDHYDVDDEAYVEYEYDPEYMAADDSWVDDSQVDADAAYYENAEYDATEDAEYDVEAYDEAYAAYLDARRRFQDLKLSRGFYPVVALADQARCHADVFKFTDTKWNRTWQRLWWWWQSQRPWPWQGQEYCPISSSR